jgi:RNA polymerase sigma factor (sigma-70 family)
VAEDYNQKDHLGITEGDTEAWREFLSCQVPQLYGMFMKRWPNPSLAEELVQKTIFDAVRGRNSFDPLKGTAEEWIFGIARNNIRFEIRRRASRGGVNGDIRQCVEMIDNERLPDEVLEQKETVAVVRAALNNLESKEQVVLRAKYIDGLPANKIAQQMGVTEKAVHSLLYRARISLRQELERIAPMREQEQVP